MYRRNFAILLVDRYVFVLGPGFGGAGVGDTTFGSARAGDGPFGGASIGGVAGALLGVAIPSRHLPSNNLESVEDNLVRTIARLSLADDVIPYRSRSAIGKIVGREIILRTFSSIHEPQQACLRGSRLGNQVEARASHRRRRLAGYPSRICCKQRLL